MRVSPAQYGVSVPGVKRVLLVNQMILARTSSGGELVAVLLLASMRAVKGDRHKPRTEGGGLPTFASLPFSPAPRSQRSHFLPEEDEAGEHDRRGPVSVPLQVRSSASEMHEAPHTQSYKYVIKREPIAATHT
jgi:hypothetical protein